MYTNEAREKKNINKKFFIINENENYSLKLYPLIEKINNSINDASQLNDNIFILNILLMSSKLSQVNKLTCLLLLYYLYQKKEKKQYYVLHYLYHKICKLYLKLDNLDTEIIQKYLYPPETENFLHSMEYIFLSKKIFSSEKNINTKYKSFINNLETETNKKMNFYLEENLSKFSSFDLMTEEDLNKLVNISNQIINDNYQINMEKNPIYLIDAMWLMKLKTFIEPYMEARKEQIIDLLCLNAFDSEKVFDFIQREENSLLLKAFGVYFPGPISNLNLNEIKDFWYDPLNEEENEILKDNLKFRENFYFINKDD